MTTNATNDLQGVNPIPTPIQRLALSEQVYESLRELLFDVRTQPGSRLVVDQLSRQLGVSQTPIREALAHLESEGLVVKEPMQGYFVTPLLDGDSFAKLYEFRQILEPAASSLAAFNAQPQDIEDLKDTIRKMETIGGGMNYGEFALHTEIDAEFHRLIASASANGFLEDAIVHLNSHRQLSRLYSNHGLPEPKATLPEHLSILEAIQDKDAKAAAKAMSVHIESSRKRLMKLLEGR